MSKTLKEAQEEIFYFITEAEKCLDIDCGYSAMSTLFAVILTVSEAVTGKRGKGKTTDGRLIDSFLDLLTDKDWFMPNNVNTPSDDEIKKYMKEVRNGLSHQISLPLEVGLIKTKNEREKFSWWSVSYFISVKEFIASVKTTLEVMLQDDKYALATIDPNLGSFTLISRDVSSRSVFKNPDGTTTSGSAPSSVLSK